MLKNFIMADFIYYSFYCVLLALPLFAVWAAINIFRNRPSWGQVRAMGATAGIFLWIQIIFYFALVDGAFGLISFMADFPIWADLSIFIIFLLVLLFIFYKLNGRNKFKPALFISLVIVPLGLPGSGLIAKLLKIEAIELSQKAGVYYIARRTNELNQIWPQNKITPIGKIIFKTSHEKGSLGDRFTAIRLTGMGFTKMSSKIDKIHGVDSVYLKKFSNNKAELRIVENKVDSASLRGDQMTDEWIKDNARKLVGSNDEKLQETGKLILEAYENNNIVITRELWKYNLEKTSVKITLLDESAKKIREIEPPKGTDTLIKKEIERSCDSGKLNCELN